MTQLELTDVIKDVLRKQQRETLMSRAMRGMVLAQKLRLAKGESRVYRENRNAAR